MHIRKGQARGELDRETFGQRFRANAYDPQFGEARDAVARLEAIAWSGDADSRKSPLTRPAGEGHADLCHELPRARLDAELRIHRAIERAGQK